jgi:hypothetical protein
MSLKNLKKIVFHVRHPKRLATSNVMSSKKLPFEGMKEEEEEEEEEEEITNPK